MAGPLQSRACLAVSHLIQGHYMSPAEIRKLRESLGLTQEQVAKKLGAGRATIARWEAGETKPHRLYEQALEKLKARAKMSRK